MRKLIKNEDRNLNSAMGQAMGDVMRSLGHTLERIGSLDMSGEDRRLLEEELEWGFQNRFMKEFYNIVPLSVDSHIRTNKSLQRLLFATLVTERLMRKKDWSALYKIRPILEEKFAIVKSAPNSPIRLNRRFTLVDLRDLVRLQKYSLRKRPEAQNNRPWWS